MGFSSASRMSPEYNIAYKRVLLNVYSCETRSKIKPIFELENFSHFEMREGFLFLG